MSDPKLNSHGFSQRAGNVWKPAKGILRGSGSSEFMFYRMCHNGIVSPPNYFHGAKKKRLSWRQDRLIFQQNRHDNQMSHQKNKPDATTGNFRDSKSNTDKVQEDGVMKELFRKEEITRQKWEKQWGFLKNPKKYWLDEASRRGLPTNIFTGRDSRRVPISQSWAELKTENLVIHPSPSIPERTSGMIGWRSSLRENEYNSLVGPLYVSPKLSMNPPLAEDEPDPEKQKFIFLG